MKGLCMLLSLAIWMCPVKEEAFAPTIKIAPEASFKLLKTKGGVSLYERWVNVTADRRAREMKAEFTVQADVTAILALLQDESKATKWLKGADAFKLLSTESLSWTSYVRYNIPIKDQDCVLQYTCQTEKDTVLIRFKSATHEQAPPKTGVKRMQGVRGSWQLIPQSDQQTKIAYTIITTQKPTLPRWLTDPIVQNNLLDTMNAFAAQLAH